MNDKGVCSIVPATPGLLYTNLQILFIHAKFLTYSLPILKPHALTRSYGNVKLGVGKQEDFQKGWKYNVESLILVFTACGGIANHFSLTTEASVDKNGVI